MPAPCPRHARAMPAPCPRHARATHAQSQPIARFTPAPPSWEKRLRTRPGRVRFFKFYRVGRVRDASTAVSPCSLMGMGIQRGLTAGRSEPDLSKKTTVLVRCKASVGQRNGVMLACSRAPPPRLHSPGVGVEGRKGSAVNTDPRAPLARRQLSAQRGVYEGVECAWQVVRVYALRSHRDLWAWQPPPASPALLGTGMQPTCAYGGRSGFLRDPRYFPEAPQGRRVAAGEAGG
eukprot:gene22083-biopygen20709